MRALWFGILVVLAACGGGPVPVGTDGTTDSGSTVTGVGSNPSGTTEGVVCLRPLKPEKNLLCSGDTPVCCYGGALGITPSCVADVASCNSDAHLVCDDVTDCPSGQRCCVAEVQSGQGTALQSVCREQCRFTLFRQEKEGCNGEGTCFGDRVCCQDDDDVYGECKGSIDRCPTDTGP